MSTPLVPRRRTYLSYLFDNRQWDLYRPWEGDVIVSTSYKSGTTWMQNIVRHLRFEATPPPLSAISPWIDRRRDDTEAVMARFAAQPHHRIIKSHMPADGLPVYPEVRHIIVVRDPRDVFMSMWNHYSGYTDAFYARVNTPGVVPLPRCPDSIHTFWNDWITRGWFPGESEGWPIIGNLHHTASWWPLRHLPNVLFVHYADLLANLPAEILRIAGFLRIPLTAARLGATAEAVSFEAIRRDAAAAAPVPIEYANATWQAGLETFFHKGTNGRWRGVLTPAELALCDAALARCLPADCATFVTGGRAARIDSTRVADPVPCT